MRHVIGVAGTAKNTGKTTTFQAVAGYLRSRGMPVFLTSIGYDGEDLDNVTGLPKPKITVQEGDQVATALPLLTSSTVRFVEEENTGLRCALGPVVKATAVSAGKVVIAGPASTKEVEEILKIVPPERTVLLDGALSRLAPMSLASSIIIATGAARSEDPRFIATELRGISVAMSLPVWKGSRSTGIHVSGGLYVKGAEETLPPLLLTQVIAKRHGPGQSSRRVRLDIDGPVNPEVLLLLLESTQDIPVKMSLVARHPVDLLLSGDHTLWPRVLSKVSEAGHELSVRQPASLLGFTINPYVPRPDPKSGGYRADQVPARPFLEAVRSLVTAECTDIVLEGPDLLEGWLRNLMFARIFANV